MTEIGPRTPRIRDPKYLSWIRKQGCVCGCTSPPPSDAAHLRSGSLQWGKRPTGWAEKPSDYWALPLKHSCHMAQHDFGNELMWWQWKRIDPFLLATIYHNRAVKAGESAPIMPKARAIKSKLIEDDYQPKKIKPRKPRALRAKIRSRGFVR